MQVAVEELDKCGLRDLLKSSRGGGGIRESCRQGGEGAKREGRGGTWFMVLIPLSKERVFVALSRDLLFWAVIARSRPFVKTKMGIADWRLQIAD
jgi:hypothetical protein